MPETMRAIRLTGPVDIDGLTGACSRTPAAGRCRRSPTSPGTDSARPAANRRYTHARPARVAACERQRSLAGSLADTLSGGQLRQC
jgi:hypothetical protein